MDELLHKYFEGKSSWEEENMLIRYFLQDNVDEAHKPYTPIFRFLAEERQLHRINSSKGKVKSLHFRTIGIAACLTAAIIIGGLIRMQTSRPVTQSMVYVDGQRITNSKLFREQALNSVNEAISIDSEILNTQIDMLNLFTE